MTAIIASCIYHSLHLPAHNEKTESLDLRVSCFIDPDDKNAIHDVLCGKNS